MFITEKVKISDVYKHHISLFIKLIALLALVGLFERCIFALFHSHLSTTFSLLEIFKTLFWGLKFDIALAGFFGILYLLSAYFLKRILSISERKTFQYLSYIFVSTIFFLQGGDIIYFSDASRHLGYEITDTFNDAPQLLATAFTIYKLPLFIHILLYPVLLLLTFKLVKSNNNREYKLTGLKNIHLELIYFSLLIFSLILARGGFQSIPIEPLHAQEISNSEKASLALNGAYNAIFYIFNKGVIKPVPINSPASLDMDSTIKNMYPNKHMVRNNEKPWQPNIIFIFLESWSAMHMQSYGYDKNTTPFFDSLRKKSLSSLEMIAGGHRTTEGLYTSLCSAQNPLGQTVAQSQLQEYKYYCLPHALREIGYETAFFQGSNKNTSGTGAFAQSLGFTKSTGRADITRRKYKENHWGVYDQDLYNYVYKNIKHSNTPVLYAINTNTTHDIQLPDGIKPQFTGNNAISPRLSSLYFADTALKDFFNKIENDNEIKDTLWVIVADHTAGLKASRLNNYRVPFLIYHKNKVKAQLVNRFASQRDIAPTLLDILNINVPLNFTGKTLLRSNNPPYFADYYHSGIIGWIEDNLLLEIPVANTDKLTCYEVGMNKSPKNIDDCSEDSIRNNALAFTKKNQSLLFEGKTSLEWN